MNTKTEILTRDNWKSSIDAAMKTLPPTIAWMCAPRVESADRAVIDVQTGNGAAQVEIILCTVRESLQARGLPLKSVPVKELRSLTVEVSEPKRTRLFVGCASLQSLVETICAGVLHVLAAGNTPGVKERANGTYYDSAGIRILAWQDDFDDNDDEVAIAPRSPETPTPARKRQRPKKPAPSRSPQIPSDPPEKRETTDHEHHDESVSGLE